MPQKDEWGRSCGFLNINEEDKKKKFEKRYFILNKLHGHLEWYTNNPLGNEVVDLCGIINLDYITIVDEAKKMKPNYCFVINTIHQSYFVQASCQREMEEWVHIINDASKIIVPPDALIHRPLYDENQQPGSGDIDSSYSSSTLTEIVGNVVVKKKLSEYRKPSFEHANYRRTNTGDLTRSLTDGGRDHSARIDTDSGVKHSNVVKKGWVGKQNRARKTFKSRYVVLKKDGFVYYKSERMSKHPLNQVAMKEIFGAKAEDEETTYLYDNMVVVITLHKIFYFQAESRDEMHAWVDAFNKTVRESKANGGKNVKVSYQQSSSVGGSTEELDEPHPALSIPASKKQSRKHSLNSTSSMKSDYNRAGSFDSVLESVPDGSPLQTCREHPETTSDKKVPIRGPVRTRACSAEDEGVRRQPELGRVQSMIDYGEQMANNRHKSCERKVSSENFVLTHLDPQIDNRSALRPSLLKKKKTLGILFSFNTMLSKKREKIQKETAKLKSEQEKSHY